MADEFPAAIERGTHNRRIGSEGRAVDGENGRNCECVEHVDEAPETDRLPYSCQAQFGTSGLGVPPAGGVSTVRGIGCFGSHSSTLTMTHTASRASSGNLSGGRSAMAEYATRSVGSLNRFGDFTFSAGFLGCLLTP